MVMSIEERNGHLYAYEIKWGTKIVAAPKDWLTAYPTHSSFTTINQENYLEFAGVDAVDVNYIDSH